MAECRLKKSPSKNFFGKEGAFKKKEKRRRKEGEIKKQQKLGENRGFQAKNSEKLSQQEKKGGRKKC